MPKKEIVAVSFSTGRARTASINGGSEFVYVEASEAPVAPAGIGESVHSKEPLAIDRRNHGSLSAMWLAISIAVREFGSGL
jgi:hypothetical protein